MENETKSRKSTIWKALGAAVVLLAIAIKMFAPKAHPIEQLLEEYRERYQREMNGSALGNFFYNLPGPMWRIGDLVSNTDTERWSDDAYYEILEHSTNAIPYLVISIASESDVDLRGELIDLLREAGKSNAIPHLIQLLHENEDPSVRIRVADHLGGFNTDEVNIALRSALGVDPDIDAQVAVIAALGNLEREDNHALLTSLLDHQEDALREQAADSIAYYAGQAPPVQTRLIEMVNEDRSANVRMASAYTLGNVAGTHSSPHLVHAFENDVDGSVRSACAYALRRYLNDVAVVKALGEGLREDEVPDVRRTAAETLGLSESAEAIPYLAKALLKDLSDEVRLAAAQALEQIEDENTLPALQTALANDAVADVRIASIETLSAHRFPRAIPPLIKALAEDTDYWVREVIAEALQKFPPRESINAALVTALVEDPSDEVRTAAANSLGLVGDASIVPRLTEILDDEADELETQIAAAHALGQIGAISARNTLAEVLQASTETVLRDEAAMAIARINPPDAYELLSSSLAAESIAAEKPGLVNALGELRDPRATDELLKLLKHGDFDLAEAAAEALGAMGDDRAVAPLTRSAKKFYVSRNTSESIPAIAYLGEIGSPKALPFFKEILANPKMSDVHEDVCWALGKIHHPDARHLLHGQLTAEAFRPAFAACFSLTMVGDTDSVPHLEPLLEHNDEQLRLAAACALAFTAGRFEAGELAEHLQSTSPWERFAALNATVRIGSPEAIKLAELRAADTSAGVRAMLKAFKQGEGAKALGHALDDVDEDIRFYAVRCLEMHDDPATLPLFDRAGNDRDEDVREAARSAARRMRARQ